MAPRKFNKKNSTTFSLLHRAQNDPKIHDHQESDFVFAEKPQRNLSKRHLEEEFGQTIRNNEGEAAQHDIFFDDSEYDYMQHLKEIGTDGGAQFFEAVGSTERKGKQKMSLEHALAELDFEDDLASQASSQVSRAESLLPDDLLPSRFVQKISYQNQMDVPDSIAGFQPDMDPRLREVLEALDDEAFVDDDQDLFDVLQQDAEEVDQKHWERLNFDDLAQHDDEGWESDHTIKADNDGAQSQSKSEDHPVNTGEGAGDGDWMKEFNKFKSDKAANTKSRPKLGTIPADLQSSIHTGVSSIAGLKRKKRKGALTTTSGYSMTSSVLRRTEELSILDQRFDRIQEEYADEEMDDQASLLSGLSQMSGLSKVSALSKASNTSAAPSLVRPDFDSIMDDFLGDYSQVGRRRVRKGKPQGIEQLDEIRNELGPARVSQQNKMTTSAS